MVRGTDKENFVASSARLGVPERLRHRLDTGSPRTRLAAAEALADFGDEQSIERLTEALDDMNADVRLSAALALAAAGEAPPAKWLVDKLGIGTRENSMLIVGLFRDIAVTKPEEIRGLIEDRDMSPSVKVAAIDALSLSGDYSLVPLIADLALKADPAGEELPRYLRALGDLGHPAAARAVEHALSSETWWARAAAAQAAGRIGLMGSADRLVCLLDDPQWWVRFRAGEALASMGEEGHRLLREAAASGSEPGRTAARLTLAERDIPAHG
jgi:HEAT repeat protein